MARRRVEDVLGIEELTALRERNAAWKLLRAENAPLVLGFLGRVFVEENVRALPAAELASALDDQLYALNEGLPEPRYPRRAKDYLEDWVGAGWLRKYYPVDVDEPYVDATAALEKAVAWVSSLAERTFVGTESRLNTIVELLRQMAVGSQADPQARLADLHARRAALDAEIAQVEAGTVDVLDETALRDRYQQFSETARQLLSDFREVEANFRNLDRSMRAQIAGWNGSKADLLEEVLGDRNAITDSDQGRSFQAFHDFLLSSQRQDELESLLDAVHRLAAITADRRMRRVHLDWLDAGEQTQLMVRQLSDQLRRFLDDQVWLENRRVMDVIRQIESHALKLRDQSPPDVTTTVDALRTEVTVPMDRPLYSPPPSDGVDSSIPGTATAEVDATALFAQRYVDTDRIISSLNRTLAGRDQVTLAEVVGAHPLEQGLAEVVGYLATDLADISQVVDPDAPEVLTWSDHRGQRDVTLPRVIFTKHSTSDHGGSP